MRDITTQLREPYWVIPYNGGPLRHKAAAEIERLRQVTREALTALKQSRRALVSGGFTNAAWLTPIDAAIAQLEASGVGET